MCIWREREREERYTHLCTIVIDDVRNWGYNYVYNDRWNCAKSKEICRIYLGRYATASRIGRAVTDQDRARIWNGGPNGWNKQATVGYWNKVKQHL